MKMTTNEILHDLEALAYGFREEQGCEPVCLGEAIRVIKEHQDDAPAMTKKRAAEILKAEAERINSRSPGVKYPTRTEAILLAIEALEDRQPAKWIDYPMSRWIYAQCSECKYINNVKTNFCPNCGADMRGGADHESN